MVKSHPKIIDPANISEELHIYIYNIYIYIQKGPKKNRVRLDRQVGKKNSFHCGSQKHLAGFHPRIWRVEGDGAYGLLPR